jgi:D-beta-D-heptose 7-phosphate kinase/D-beta-D-heptose 1-phosphate adenosyltransferase
MKNFNIGVVGDAMIDEYYSVRIKGVSPEFPIPVMHSLDSVPRVCPGGAANVANQFNHFKGFDVKLVSFIDDYFKSCFSNSINIDFCKSIETHIPVKRRFYSNGFPTYRWDVESQNYGLGTEIKRRCLDLHEGFFSNSKNFDCIIISDYGKGVFNLEGLNYIPKDTLTIVDSKSFCVDKWYGCTIYKPNFKEAIEVSGKSNAIDAGNWIRSRIKCQYVIITNADNGVTIVSKDGHQEIKPEVILKKAVSVIGAGDCFTAMLAVSLLNGYNIFDATNFAWRAGCKYVQKEYNSPIVPVDLVEDKFLEDPTILNSRNFKLCFTNGCFDLIHRGHIENLKFAKSKADKLVVALNDDDSVSRLKQGRPIQKLKDRISILSSLEFVDYIVSFSDNTPLSIIEKIRPDVLVKGDEYDFNEIVGSDIIKEVFAFPMVDGLSTTSLIGKFGSTQKR